MIKSAMWPWGTASATFSAADLSLCLHIARQYHLDNRACIWPWWLQRCVIEQITGCQFVIVLLAELATKIPDDIDRWLADQHYTALSECEVYLLEPGDHLMLPFGSAALPVAAVRCEDGSFDLTRKKKGSKVSPSDFCSYVVHVPFDAASDEKHPLEIKSAILARYISACNWVPAAWRGNARVVAWKAALQTGQGEEADTPLDGAVDGAQNGDE